MPDEQPNLELDPQELLQALNDEGYGDDPDNQGQEPESPTGDQDPPKGQKSDPPADDEDEDDSKSSKAPPYDQDPKWKEARAAQKVLQEILEDNGYESYDELKESLQSGRQLKDMIGTRDARRLVEKAETLEKYEAYWAEQEAKRMEESETPDETIERLKREKAELADQQRRKQKDEEAAEESRRLIERYNKEVRTIVNDADLDESGKELVTLMLGVDNPSEDIEPGDKAAIRNTANDMISRVNEFVKAVSQKAIDDYARGKSKLKPLKKSSTDTPTKSAEKVDIDKDLGLEDSIASINAQVLEMVRKM